MKSFKISEFSDVFVRKNVEFTFINSDFSLSNEAIFLISQASLTENETKTSQQIDLRYWFYSNCHKIAITNFNEKLDLTKK